MDNIYIADLQGFRGNNKEFIVKMLAFTRIKGDEEIQQVIFKPPFAFNNLQPERQKEAKFTIDSLHKINWNEGSLDYFNFNFNIIEDL